MVSLLPWATMLAAAAGALVVSVSDHGRTTSRAI
jgi:hypothetical protein